MNINSLGALLLFAFSIGNVVASGNKNTKFIYKIISPNYINLQYAGNLGLGAVGVGYLSKNEKHNFGLSYGFLPSSVNGVKVHTISAKGTFNFRKHCLSENTFVMGYAGANLLRSYTNNTFLKFPDYYPNGYYFTNAIHLAPFLGVKLGMFSPRKRKLTRYSYLELGTLDYYLLNMIKYNRSKVIDYLNICMGISIPLNTNWLE